MTGCGCASTSRGRIAALLLTCWGYVLGDVPGGFPAATRTTLG